jgi:hypothetical protein
MEIEVRETFEENHSFKTQFCFLIKILVNKKKALIVKLKVLKEYNVFFLQKSSELNSKNN